MATRVILGMVPKLLPLYPIRIYSPLSLRIRGLRRLVKERKVENCQCNVTVMPLQVLQRTELTDLVSSNTWKDFNRTEDPCLKVGKNWPWVATIMRLGFTL